MGNSNSNTTNANQEFDNFYDIIDFIATYYILTMNFKSLKNLAEKNGFEYKRFAVRDYAAPDLKQLEEMVKFIKTLPADKKIYAHCAGGEGRTTNFLVLLDIIKNGKKLSLKEILDRQAKLGGAKLDDFAKKEEWRKKLGAERLKLIEEFYQNQTK